jgi:hypothetical protein
MNDPKAPTLTYADFRAFITDKTGRSEFVDRHAAALASPASIGLSLTIEALHAEARIR